MLIYSPDVSQMKTNYTSSSINSLISQLVGYDITHINRHVYHIQNFMDHHCVYAICSSVQAVVHPMPVWFSNNIISELKNESERLISNWIEKITLHSFFYKKWWFTFIAKHTLIKLIAE